MRVETGEREEKQRGSPGKANNSEQSDSVPKVPDPRYLPQTGLVILCSQCNSTEPAHRKVNNQRKTAGMCGVCETHLACLDRGPEALMVSGIHLGEETEKRTIRLKLWVIMRA